MAKDAIVSFLLSVSSLDQRVVAFGFIVAMLVTFVLATIIERVSEEKMEGKE